MTPAHRLRQLLGLIALDQKNINIFAHAPIITSGSGRESVRLPLWSEPTSDPVESCALNS